MKTRDAAPLLDLRKSGEVRRGSSKVRLQRMIQAECKRIENNNTRKAKEWREQLDDWAASEGFWRAHFWFSKKPQPKVPEYESTTGVQESLSRPEYLVEKVADFPIVTETDPPTDKTPEECSPTKQEIKGFLEA